MKHKKIRDENLEADHEPNMSYTHNRRIALKNCAFLMLCGLLVGGNATAELSVGPPRTGQCMLWEHRDMQGAHLRLSHGERMSFAGDTGNSAWREVPSWNDIASSAKAGAGCRLRVWEHMLGEGASKDWANGSNSLLIKYVGSAWNDRISSATCLCD